MTQEQMQELAKIIAEHGMPPNWKDWGLLIALFVVGSGLSAYLGAFFAKHGEIGAIKRSLKDVIGHQRTLTTTTATISSNISRLDWLDQKRWEVKQKFYWEILVIVDEMRTNWNYSIGMRELAEKENDNSKKVGFLEEENNYLNIAMARRQDMRRLASVAGVIVSDAVATAIREFIVSCAAAKPATEGLAQWVQAGTVLYVQLKDAARADLELQTHPEHRIDS